MEYSIGEDRARQRVRVSEARRQLLSREDRLGRREAELVARRCGCTGREAGLLGAEYMARQRVGDLGLDPSGVAAQVDRLLFGASV